MSPNPGRKGKGGSQEDRASTTAFAKDKIYTCKPIAAAVVLESGQTYSETLDTMDEEAALLSVVPTSQFLISKEEGFFYKNNPTRDFESLLNFENLVDHKEFVEFEKNNNFNYDWINNND